MSNPSLTPVYTPAANTAPAEKYYVQPTLGHALRIWWAFYWRNTLISISILFAVGVVLAALKRYIPYSRIISLIPYISYVIEYTVAIFVIHFIARKKFRDFRIILTAQRDGSVDILEPTFRRTFRIWLTFAWRSVVYAIALSVAMYVPIGFLSGAVAVIFPPLAGLFNQFARSVVAGAVGLFTIYSNILDEDISGFRVSLAPRDAISLPSEAPNLGPLPRPSGSVASK
jgi:hypothetical protein